MIGGADLILEVGFGPDELVRFTRSLRRLWPDLVAETLTSGPASLEILAAQLLEGEREFFFYRTPAARASWEEDGMTADNQADLVHLVLGRDTTTVVLDRLGTALHGQVSRIAEELGLQGLRRISPLRDTELRIGQAGPARMAA